MMMRLLLSLLRILFLPRVTSIEHYWVTLRERRGPGEFDDLRFLLRAAPRRTPRPWLVLQNASQTFLLVSPPPQQHSGQSRRKLSRQLPIGHSLGSFQDNPTAERNRLRSEFTVVQSR